MNKTLKVFQILTKIAKYITAIITFGCILLIVGCVIGIILLKRLELGNQYANDYVLLLTKYLHSSSLNENYAVLTIGIIMSFVRLAITTFAHHYFRKVEETGHPFTTKLTDELFRLGILQLIIPTSGLIMGKVAQIIFQNLFNETYNYGFGLFTFIPLGFFYIFTSFICKVGTERLFMEKNNISIPDEK